MQYNRNGNGRFSQSTAKPKNTRETLKKLGVYLFKYKYLLFIVIILSIISNILSLIGPKLSGDALDILSSGKGNISFNKIYFLVGLMIIFYVLSSVLSFILARLMIHISQKIIYKMRKDVFNKLENLPISFYDKYQTGDIISRISYDIDTVNSSLTNDLINIIKAIITLFGSLGFMIFISPLLTLVFVIMLPLSYFLTRYLTKKTKPLFRKKSHALGNLNGYTEEMLSGIKTIKAYNNEKSVYNDFNLKNEDAVKATYEAEYYAFCMGPMMTFINNLSLALISCVGAVLYLYKKISIGKIAAFIQYSKKSTGPINEIANVISELQSALAAFERITSIIDMDVEKEDAVDAYNLDNSNGNVDFKNVDFSYTLNTPVLSDISFKANKGNLIAIVGPTGSGKTTIINLLMRFYDPDSGLITIDNKNILKVKRNNLRTSFTMVLQDSWLFNGTIKENLRYGNKNATDDEIIAVAKKCKIHDFIMKLKSGYDTIIEENGINISKGQKQLLTIARAMLVDSSMLILDEATSNVDTKTELQIQQALISLMKDKTCFVIAHRLSTIKNADLILVIKDGKLIEKGNQKELLDKKGVYAQMYNSQFE